MKTIVCLLYFSCSTYCIIEFAHFDHICWFLSSFFLIRRMCIKVFCRFTNSTHLQTFLAKFNFDQILFVCFVFVCFCFNNKNEKPMILMAAMVAVDRAALATIHFASAKTALHYIPFELDRLADLCHLLAIYSHCCSFDWSQWIFELK